MPFTRGIRGGIGLAGSLCFLAMFIFLHTGPGPGSWDRLIEGDAGSVTALAISLLFLIGLLWRGASMAYEEISLERLRGSFRWGLVAVVVAVVADAFGSQDIIGPYLALGFFAVGLSGMSLARFTSAANENQEMATGWWAPMGFSVGGVILLALLIGALGAGGLDDFAGTRLRSMGEFGLWVLKPVFLALGLLASVLVSLGNLIAGWFGGGDLTGLELVEQRLTDFEDQLESARNDNGPPAILVGALKGLGLAVVFGLAAWLLYRVFRFRRNLQRPSQVEETRESLLTWSRANRDLSDLLSGGWNSASPTNSFRRGRTTEPANAREFYHRFLEVSEQLGRPRWEWETPKQHQNAMRSLSPLAPVSGIVDAFQTSRYGGSATDQMVLGKLRMDWAIIIDFIAGQNQAQREGQK